MKPKGMNPNFYWSGFNGPSYMPTNPPTGFLIAFLPTYLPLKPTCFILQHSIHIPSSYFLVPFFMFFPFDYLHCLSFNIFSMSPSFCNSTLACWNGWGILSSLLFILCFYWFARGAWNSLLLVYLFCGCL